MANKKPYMTSTDFVESVKKRIAFPIDQSTFSFNDILDFANEEMLINAVPQIIQEHEEYFIYKQIVPLVPNISRYGIPNRTLGMALRDLKYSDTNGNYLDMSRIAPEDKAFFQNNTGANQTITKYYLEGNEVVLTPQLMTNPTGNLNFFIYLRPNSLVRNDRACTILGFKKDIIIADNSAINAGDTITIVTGNESQYQTVYTFTAVNSSAQTLVSAAVSTDGTTSVVTTTNPHNIPVGENFEVVVVGVTGSTPDVNGRYSVSSLGPNTFSAPFNVTVAGSGGSYLIVNQFVIGVAASNTAANLNTAINAIGLTSTVSGAIVTNTYSDISNTFLYTKADDSQIIDSFLIDNDNLFIQFDQLPTTYTDPDTQAVDTLYSNGCLVDMLQTLPGHRTYTYDVTLQAILSGNVGMFSVAQMQTFLNNSSAGTESFYPMVVGDYMCLQNECIIPQIPPELHSALAERTASRILMAIGDRDGYAVSQQKIAEMNSKQATLIGSRVEGAQTKVFNKSSLLRCGKRNVRRRFF